MMRAVSEYSCMSRSIATSTAGIQQCEQALAGGISLQNLLINSPGRDSKCTYEREHEMLLLS